MIITCDQCSTKFNLDESLLKGGGAKVRCSVCKTVFTAHPPSVSEVPEAIGSDAEPGPAFFDQDEGLPEDSPESEEDLSKEMATASDEPEDLSIEDPGGEESAGLGVGELEDVTKMFEMDETAEAPEFEAAETDEEIDLDLDFEVEEPVAPGSAGEEELDLSELDDDLDFETQLETDEGQHDAESLDLESEFDAALPLEPKAGEELDLSELEDDLDFAALPGETDDEKVEAGEDDEEFDLDLDLDVDAAPVSEEDAEVELDLPEFDDGLELEIESEETESDEAGSGEELDIDLDFESEETSGDEEAEEALDLSELEEGLKLEAESDEAEDDEEFDLDLDLDIDSTPVSEDEAEEELDLSDIEDSLELDELSEEPDLDLDLDIDAAPVSGEDTEAELDLSDIEDSLELDEPSESSDNEDDLETLDLDLDIESAVTEEPEDQAEELDFSDMEEMISLDADDESEEKTDIEPDDDAELLDLGIEEPTDDGEESALEAEAAFEEETLDLSDIENMIKDEETAETPADETPDKEKPEPDKAEAKIDDPVDDLLISDDEEELESLDDLEGPDPVARKKKKGGKKKAISTPVMMLLVLMLIGGGGYGAFVGLTAMGIQIPYMDTVKNLGSQIPFLSDFIKPPVEDVGNLKISTMDISGKFVNNAGAGKLFVITGSAKNGYPEPRALIKVNGKLYSKGKRLVKTEKVYCGNSLTEKQLSELELETIRKRLNNRAGDKKSNLNVAPGRVIPFMIVFSGLPENLEEYTIEVAESFPAAKK